MRHFSIAKLLLSLLIIVCLTVAVWSGYVLFTHQTNPVWGSVILLVDIGVLIWNISVLRSRRWRWKNPKFKWVFLSILAVFLVCAFAGIQPLSTYKDDAVGIVEEGIGKLTTLAQTATTETNEKTRNSKVATPVASYELHGTYTATVGFDPFSPDPTKSVKRTLTFKGDTFTSYDDYLGKTICKYFIPGGLKSGQVIIYTNIATGKQYTERFKYTAEYDCFTIGEGLSTVTYYK